MLLYVPFMSQTLRQPWCLPCSCGVNGDSVCGGSVALTGVSCATLILHSLSRWLLPSSAPAWTSYGSKAGLPKCRTNSFPSSLGSEVSGQSSCGIQLHTHKSSPDWSMGTDPMMLAHFTGAASHFCLLLGEGSKRRVLSVGSSLRKAVSSCLSPW